MLLFLPVNLKKILKHSENSTESLILAHFNFIRDLGHFRLIWVHVLSCFSHPPPQVNPFIIMVYVSSSTSTDTIIATLSLKSGHLG